MAGYQYAPTGSGAAIERPRCWGKGFNESDRECRGCGFQNSCKEEIIRSNVNRPTLTAPVQPSMQQPGFYQPGYPQPQPAYYSPVGYAPAQPTPITPPPIQPQRMVARTTPYQPPPIQQPQVQIPARTLNLQAVQGGYGWLQDPMYYTLHSAPPPMRPQLQGETFFDRVVKNAALSVLESFFGSMLLAVRQMIWAPETQTSGSVLNVTPPPVR